MLGPEVVTLTAGVALFTTWTRTAELVELYCAVILCEPTERLDVVNVAVVPDMTPLPMLVEPSKKTIVPVFPVGTVPVKATDCK